MLQQVPYLRVRDLERSIAWYKSVLGFVVDRVVADAGRPFWALFWNGAVSLMISDRPARTTAHTEEVPHDHASWGGVP